MMNQVDITQQEKNQPGSHANSPSKSSLKRHRSSSSLEEVSKRLAPLNRPCEEEVCTPPPEILEPESPHWPGEYTNDFTSPHPDTSPQASSEYSQDDVSFHRARRRLSLGVAKDEVTSPSEDLESELVESTRFYSRRAKLEARRAMMMKDEEMRHSLGGQPTVNLPFDDDSRPSELLEDEFDAEPPQIGMLEALKVLSKVPNKIVNQCQLSDVELDASRQYPRCWPPLDPTTFSNLNLVPEKLPNELEWVLENATVRSEDKIYSESYEYHGIRFRIMLQPPKTSRVRPTFSIYLECLGPIDHDGTRSWNLPGLSFHLIALNFRDWRHSRYLQSIWPFSTENQDRGWTDFFGNEQLSDFVGSSGQIVIRAAIFPKSAEWKRSQKQEGAKYVGLKNHGATCYMNSLMQHLYHIGQFRKAIFEFDPDDVVLSDKETSGVVVPDSESLSKSVKLPPITSQVDDAEAIKVQRRRVADWVNMMSEQEIRNVLEELDSFPNQSEIPISVAMQNLFYKMSSQNEACDCRQMLKAFGWGVSDAFDQHDATELMKIVVDRLENQLVDTPSAGQIEKIFGGSMASVVRCINVEFESVKEEKFYDLVLMVKNSRTLESAIRDFGEPDILDGDNMYDAEGHGRQPAKKFMKFVKVPMVLNCMLRRLEWDCASFAQKKVTDVFEFPKEIDFSQYNEDAGMYDLHAVVVHSGDASSGHYYTFIRPQCQASWLKFDDDKVSSVPECAAIYDNFGGREVPSWNYFQNFQPVSLGMDKPHSAYMLTYVNRKYRDELLREWQPSDLNSRLVERKSLEESRIQCQKLLSQEITTHVKLDLITQGVLFQADNLDFWRDTRQLPAATSLKVKRQMSVHDLHKMICDQAPTLLGYPNDPTTKVGMWYFDYDGESSNKVGPNALRLWTFEYNQIAKPGPVSDVGRHLSYVDQRLVERYKPTFRVLVHPVANGPEPLQKHAMPIKIFNNVSDDPTNHSIIFLGFCVCDDTTPEVLERFCREKLACHATSQADSRHSKTCDEILKLLSCPEQLATGGGSQPKLVSILEDDCFQNENRRRDPPLGLTTIFYPKLHGRLEAIEWSKNFGFQNAEVYEQVAGNGQVAAWNGAVIREYDDGHLQTVQSDSCPSVSACRALDNSVAWSVPAPPLPFPPFLPLIPCVSPADWWEARECRCSLTVRVWDLPRFFGLWRSAGGDVLNESGSREFSPSTARNGNSDAMATPTSVRSTTDPDVESPLSSVSGWSRSVVIDVDTRWPFRLAFRYIAYHLGIHEDYLLLTADSPLDSRRLFSSFHAHSFVGKPHKLQDTLNHLSVVNRVCHMSILPRSVLELDLDTYTHDGQHTQPSRTREKPLLVRVMSARHDSVGFVIVNLSLNELKVRDVIKQAESQITDTMKQRLNLAEWPQWRLVETYPDVGYPCGDDSKSFRVLSPDVFWTVDNAFMHTFDPSDFLRMEPCPGLPPNCPTVAAAVASRYLVVRVNHRGVDGELFGFPFEMVVNETDTVGVVRERIFTLLNPPMAERQKWRVFRLEMKASQFVPSNPISGAERDNFFSLRLRDEIEHLCAHWTEDELPCLKNFRVLVEHPNPLSTGHQSRRNVPLHIK